MIVHLEKLNVKPQMINQIDIKSGISGNLYSPENTDCSKQRKRYPKLQQKPMISCLAQVWSTDFTKVNIHFVNNTWLAIQPFFHIGQLMILTLGFT